MKITCCLLALTLLASAPRAQDGGDSTPHELTMLRMFDGSILWGSIDDTDAQSLHFTRLDNGGKVRVPWARLDPALADELLEKFGYVDHSGDELMIEAERITLTDGSEVIGRIVNRTDTELWIKTADSVQPIQKLRIRGAATTVQVPALDVYSREELYQEELAKLDPTSVKSEWDMSIYCERIFDFAHSIEHLQAAQHLDASFKPEEIKTALQRNTARLAEQVQIDDLREVDHLRARGKFDDAEKACDAFLAKYATSTLRADASKKKIQIQKAREKFLAEHAVELWHTWLQRLTQAAGRDPKMNLEAGLAYVEEQLAQDVLKHVQTELQRYSPSVTPDQVTKYWKERKSGRWHKAGYGYGTWLLGDTEARKGLEPEKKDDSKPQSETDQARAKLEERFKRFLQNQAIVSKAKSTDKDEENEHEKFWVEYSSSSRGNWLLAYYVEHAGDMQVRGVGFVNCPDCGGTCVREVINLAPVTSNSANSNGAVPSASQLVNCPTCHHVGVFRNVTYR